MMRGWKPKIYEIMNDNTFVQATIQFSEYESNTDWSLMPWESPITKKGIISQRSPTIQSQSRGSDTKFHVRPVKILFRKSSKKIFAQRSFLKLVQVLSFVGGLLNPILLVLSILKAYNQYCYQIEFGDRIFKQNNNSSFGSEDFNIIIFLQCQIYSIFEIFGMKLKWEAVKNFYRCRQQFVKQLDIHLLYKKIQLFEEVCSTVLDQHHLIGLHLLSKKTIKEAKRIRRRHMLQSIIYRQLERKGKSVDISEEQYRRVRQTFLQEERQRSQDTGQPNEVIINLQKDFSRNYRRLVEDGFMGERHSRKIMEKLQDQKREEELLSVPQDEEEQIRANRRGILNVIAHSKQVLAIDDVIQSSKGLHSQKEAMDI